MTRSERIDKKIINDQYLEIDRLCVCLRIAMGALEEISKPGSEHFPENISSHALFRIQEEMKP